MNYGFLPEPTQKDHWIVGSKKATKRFGAPELMPEGHGWKEHLPKKELQRRGSLETMACTVFGSANCWETLAKFYGYKDFPRDLAERYNAILSEITPEGGMPHKTCETFRQFGALPEEVLPFSEDIRTWDYFYAPQPMTEELKTLGKELARKFVFGHEWVFNGQGTLAQKQQKLKEALSRGTVAVSVHAWKNDGKYYIKTKDDNHWVQLVDYVEREYWLIFDHYNPVMKKVAWDTDFYCAKLHFLRRREEVETEIEKIQRKVISLLISWRNQLISLIK